MACAAVPYDHGGRGMDATTAVTTFWSTRDWAQALAALPAGGALPSRTALVPRERVAHSLRRELIRTGHAGALAGTRFISPAASAIAVLEAAGVPFSRVALIGFSQGGAWPPSSPRETRNATARSRR